MRCITQTYMLLQPQLLCREAVSDCRTGKNGEEKKGILYPRLCSLGEKINLNVGGRGRRDDLTTKCTAYNLKKLRSYFCNEEILFQSHTCNKLCNVSACLQSTSLDSRSREAPTRLKREYINSWINQCCGSVSS